MTPTALEVCILISSVAALVLVAMNFKRALARITLLRETKANGIRWAMAIQRVVRVSAYLFWSLLLATASLWAIALPDDWSQPALIFKHLAMFAAWILIFASAWDIYTQRWLDKHIPSDGDPLG